MVSTLTFPKGGVHPPEFKELTENLPIQVMPLPAELHLILGQHIGAPCTPTVAKKAVVGEGDLVADVSKGLGVPLHAPAAGSIRAIATAAHPIRVTTPSITLTVDRDAEPRQWTAGQWQHLSAQELLQKVHDAGIVGIGSVASCSHEHGRHHGVPELERCILHHGQV